MKRQFKLGDTCLSVESSLDPGLMPSVLIVLSHGLFSHPIALDPASAIKIGDAIAYAGYEAKKAGEAYAAMIKPKAAPKRRKKS